MDFGSSSYSGFPIPDSGFGTRRKLSFAVAAEGHRREQALGTEDVKNSRQLTY